MRNLSKPIAGAVLLGFLGVNIFVTVCVMAAPGMPECPMPMKGSEVPGWSTNYDCCLSCVTSTTLPMTVGFGAPIALVIPPSNLSAFSEEIPTLELDEKIPPILATVSAPVFLLNNTFLI